MPLAGRRSRSRTTSTSRASDAPPGVRQLRRRRRVGAPPSVAALEGAGRSPSRSPTSTSSRPGSSAPARRTGRARTRTGPTAVRAGRAPGRPSRSRGLVDLALGTDTAGSGRVPAPRPTASSGSSRRGVGASTPASCRRAGRWTACRCSPGTFAEPTMATTGHRGSDARSRRRVASVAESGVDPAGSSHRRSRRRFARLRRAANAAESLPEAVDR